MNFTSQIFDAMKFTLRDWKAIIILGIILCIASTSEEIYANDLIISLILFIISVLLLFIEEGYRYKIIKETIQGNNNPPAIRNFLNLIKEGFLETVTLAIFITIVECIQKLNEIILPIFDSSGISQIIFAILAIIIYLTFFGATIYKAQQGGKFLSAFNIIGILRLYYKIGILETIFLIILGSISFNLIYSCVFNLGIFETKHFIDFITSFFINPIILLFITRLMASCGREANPS